MAALPDDYITPVLKLNHATREVINTESGVRISFERFQELTEAGTTMLSRFKQLGWYSLPNLDKMVNSCGYKPSLDTKEK